LKGNYVGQRVVVATVFAEFINHCKDQVLLQKIVNCILTSLVDPSIKLQSLIGLGNITAVGSEEANKYAPTILDALMSSIDDQNEELAMEAMNGLSKVFSIVEESRMAPIIINLCGRIKPAFEKENNEIRAAAFRLFGALSRFGDGIAREAFYEQIHNNLPSLVLHSSDDSEEVSKACKHSIKQLSHLYKYDPLKELLDTLDEDSPLDFNEFVNELSKILQVAYPEKINTYVMTSVAYFKSNWDTIKANAASFVGYLLTNLSIEKRSTSNLNPGLVTKSMILLLKEKSPVVRKTTAEALGLLFDY